MNNNLTLQSIAPDPFTFETKYSTYEGMKITMPTIQMTEEEFDLNLLNENLLSRKSIQQSTIQSTITLDCTLDFDERALFEIYNDVHENKGNLIELMFYFQQAGEYNSCHADVYWMAELISSDLWSEEINSTYWDKYWDGDVDRLCSTTHACFTEYYPLN